jgi:hypothetical protein
MSRPIPLWRAALIFVLGVPFLLLTVGVVWALTVAIGDDGIIHRRDT